MSISLVILVVLLAITFGTAANALVRVRTRTHAAGPWILVAIALTVATFFFGALLSYAQGSLSWASAASVVMAVLTVASGVSAVAMRRRTPPVALPAALAQLAVVIGGVGIIASVVAGALG